MLHILFSIHEWNNRNINDNNNSSSYNAKYREQTFGAYQILSFVVFAIAKLHFAPLLCPMVARMPLLLNDTARCVYIVFYHYHYLSLSLSL